MTVVSIPKRKKYIGKRKQNNDLSGRFAIFVYNTVKLSATLICKKSVALLLSIVAAVAAAFFVLSAVTGQAPAVAVVSDGKTVACIEGENEIPAVKSALSARLVGDINESVKLVFDERIVSSASVVTAAEAAEAVLSNAEGLNPASGLYVGGMLTTVADDADALRQMLNALTAQYTSDGQSFAGYYEAIEIREIYVLPGADRRLRLSADDFLSGKSGVRVITQCTEQYDEEIPFSTVTEYDVSKINGFSYEKVSGKNGLRNVTASVTYINGKRESAEEIEAAVISEPEARVVVEGISDEALESVRLALSSVQTDVLKMAFPCKITESTYVSSYWGDGRNHEGVDIASDYGSEIYAVLDGTVSYSGWKGDYGNCIIIDHPDGKTQSLYSHCSKLLVKAGDTVTTGQTIAYVGSTGNATGNHLHFSVLLDGRQVDPAPYIGLR